MTRAALRLGVAALLIPAAVYGQGRGSDPAPAAGRGAAPVQTPQAPQTAKARAPIDLTGYWVSIVTEDWRYRMVTPTKGDYQGVPMNADARKAAENWNPEADEAAGQACKSYGAPAILRAPGRLHITWQDDQTLKADFDAGTQTRLFRFDPPKDAKNERSWQGDSTARWEALVAGPQGIAAPKSGWLKVATTNLKAGYLRKNGVPYSEDATVTEYFDLGALPNGGQVLVITSVVEDAKNLTAPFVVSTQFKKEADGSKWDPSPCSSVW